MDSSLLRQRHAGCLLLAVAVFAALPIHLTHAAQNGYCWNDKVGWVSFAGVSFDSDTRKLSGTATFSSGDGEIDFTEQSGQSISMTVSSTLSGGQYAILGQVFSEEVGWVVANHGGTDEASFTSAGKLAGNFWSNEAGWFNCAESDVGAANVHIIDNVTPTSATADSTTTTTPSSSGGGSRGSGQSMVEKISDAYQRMLNRLQGNDSGQLTEGDTPSPDATSNDQQLADSRNRLLVTINNIPVIFRDVPLDAWYTPHVAELISAGIAQGYRTPEGDLTGVFGVANPVTKAEMLKMTMQVAGNHFPASVPRNPSAQHTWASPYVATAENMHLTVFETTTDVHADATRAEVIHTLLEVLDLPESEPDPNPYTDLPDRHPYFDSILKATRLGIISGDTVSNGDPTGTIRPNDPINRAEVAKIISLLRELLRQ